MNPTDIIARLERSPAAWVCIRREAADRIKSDVARIKALEAKLDIAVEALEYYADQFCEMGDDNEGCGKFDDDTCGGCRARSALAKIKENTK